MSDPPSDAPRLREAADWFTRLGSRSITTQALRAFRDWREDPANDAAYQAVERSWRRTGALSADPDILRETDALLGQARRRRAWARPGPAAWALAVGLLALLAGGLAIGLHLGQPTLGTAVGEQRLVRLDDGTRLHINTDSRLRVDFDRGERRVLLLRGQAFFDVAHDPDRPFVVEAADARVRALGTKFDVRRDGRAVSVTLVEGAVQVASETSRAAWRLAPNQQLVMAGGRAAPRPADAAQASSWTTGRLVFRSTPLSAAVAEVNRYSDRKVQLGSEALAARPINGVFDAGDTEAFVRAVAQLFDLRVGEAPGGGVLLGAPAPA